MFYTLYQITIIIINFIFNLFVKKNMKLKFELMINLKLKII